MLLEWWWWWPLPDALLLLDLPCLLLTEWLLTTWALRAPDVALLVALALEFEFDDELEHTLAEFFVATPA